MNKIERVKTALSHREPDRVPTISCIESVAVKLAHDWGPDNA